MSGIDSPLRSGIAFQFCGALDAYERELDALLQARFNPEQYRRLTQRMDEMRLYATSLPSLSGAWVEVLIRHAELTHGVWRSQQPDSRVDIAHLRTQLGGAVGHLSMKCTQLLPAA